MQHPFNKSEGSRDPQRGRQRQSLLIPPRRSRSGEGSRPQYKDSRRQYVRTRSSKIEVPSFYQSHHMALSEPSFHDVDERRIQHSRSLSPAYPRRLTATPYDPFIIETRNRDLYQRYAEETYSQRFASLHPSLIDPEPPSNSLLMFSDSIETASTLTGWSEQELIEKRKKKNETKKEKNYGKTRKNREPRILNLPLTWKNNSNPSEAPSASGRKRYFRGTDGPNGAMTRGVIGRHTSFIVKNSSKSKHQVVPSLSRSSDAESTQSSSESFGEASNPAVQRWLKAKEMRKRTTDFPLLSTVSSKPLSFGKDAPGPVARRPSPLMHSEIHSARGNPIDPIEELRLSRSDNTLQPRSSLNTVSISRDKVLHGVSEGRTPDREKPHQFSGYLGSVMTESFDMPDDGSPTSVIPSKTFIQRSTVADESRKPKSILRNSPRSPSRRSDGTHPMSVRMKQLHEPGIGIRPREARARFSDSVEQRTYDIGEGSNYFNDHRDQGAFPIQKSDVVENMCDRFEMEQMVEELLGGGRPDSSLNDGSVLNSPESTVMDSENGTSIHPPSDDSIDVNNHHLSPMRAAKTNDLQNLEGEGADLLMQHSHLHSWNTEEQEAVPEHTIVQNRASFPQNDDNYQQISSTPIDSSSGESWIRIDEYDDAESDDVDDMAFIEVVAAVVIQTAVRRFLAIVAFERLVADHFKFVDQPNLRELPKSSPAFEQSLRMSDSSPRNQSNSLKERLPAAITIQRVFRGWWVRDSLNVDHYCATHAQRIVRGFLARTNFYYDMYCILVLQAYVRMILARDIAARRLASVVLIQTYIRGYLGRNKVFGGSYRRRCQRSEHSAAVKIQALCRSFLMRERFLNTLADILIVQSIARRRFVNQVVLPQLKAEMVEQVSSNVVSFSQRDVGPFDRDAESATCMRPYVQASKTHPRRPPRMPLDHHGSEAVEQHCGSTSERDSTKFKSVSNPYAVHKSNLRTDANRRDVVSWPDSRPGSDEPLSPLESVPHRGTSTPLVQTPLNERFSGPPPLLRASTSRRAIAVPPRAFSFEDTPSVQYRSYASLSFDESRKPDRAAANSYGGALHSIESLERDSLELGEHTQPPCGASSRRRIPKNSAAAFWEQKTSQQPNPTFPPQGWR